MWAIKNQDIVYHWKEDILYCICAEYSKCQQHKIVYEKMKQVCPTCNPNESPAVVSPTVTPPNKTDAVFTLSLLIPCSAWHMWMSSNLPSLAPEMSVGTSPWEYLKYHSAELADNKATRQLSPLIYIQWSDLSLACWTWLSMEREKWREEKEERERGVRTIERGG